MKPLNLTGRRFGRLVVGDRAENDVRGKTRWAVRCDCGTTFIADGTKIVSGHTQSCGCLQRARAKAAQHALRGTRHPLRSIWKEIVARCTNPRNHAYPLYGGRGITICARWLGSFEAFVSDMGARPSPKHSIDRRENDRGYEPGNCRWATRVEQANNTRTNRRLTANGITHTLAEWSRISGIPASTIRVRVDRLRWPVGRAVSKPLRAKKLGVVDLGDPLKAARGQYRAGGDA
ncbi:MAG TPA: hypothetical protein VGH28_13985 [Polyangiaceae bacterium]